MPVVPLWSDDALYLSTAVRTATTGQEVKDVVSAPFLIKIPTAFDATAALS